MSVLFFAHAKEKQRKISMVSCYDYWSACLVEASKVDAILVGDSMAQVNYGGRDTCSIDVKTISRHVAGVKEGAPSKFIIADMPFLSYRKDLKSTMNNVEKLVSAGANAVKLEGIKGNMETINYIVESGIPVMGHLGLLPQHVNSQGGFKVQGRRQEAQERLIQEAKAAQDSGCFALVLECVPGALAEKITIQLAIPTIGIGAGNKVDGQVLVLNDLIGLTNGRPYKFVKEYAKLGGVVISALNQYHRDVEESIFPGPSHTFDED